MTRQKSKRFFPAVLSFFLLVAVIVAACSRFYSATALCTQGDRTCCSEQEVAVSALYNAVFTTSAKACTVDADCTIGDPGPGCRSNCGGDVISKSGFTQADATLNANTDYAALCRNFISTGACFVTVNCGTAVAPTCASGQCTIP